MVHQLDKYAHYGQAHEFKEASLHLISSTSQNSFILDFGGGDRRLDLPNYINFDIIKHPSMTNVQGDGHFLPFKDNLFDVIICEAVIEHCKKPWLVADELFRCLKKDGYVYVDAAFMQPLHAHPNHFFNMTKNGLEVLFGKFQKLKSGVQWYQMPSYTLVYVLFGYLKCLFPTVNKMGYEIKIFERRAFTKRRTPLPSVILAIYKISHKILMCLDRRISVESAERMAAGVYFLGQKG